MLCRYWNDVDIAGRVKLCWLCRIDRYVFVFRIDNAGSVLLWSADNEWWLLRLVNKSSADFVRPRDVIEMSLRSRSRTDVDNWSSSICFDDEVNERNDVVWGFLFWADDLGLIFRVVAIRCWMIGESNILVCWWLNSQDRLWGFHVIDEML